MSGQRADGFSKPAFFRPMVRDFINSVSIPSAFVRHIYNQNVPDVFLLKPEIGEATVVEIKKRVETWFLGEGWTKFVEKQTVQHGDFLHFTMIDQSSFEVTIFDTTCCSKNLKDYVVKQEEEQNDYVVNAFGSATMSGQPVVGSKKPAFFRLMIGDFINSVNIPTAFTRYIYNQNVPHTILLKPEIGEAAVVEIEKRDKRWSFGKGWTKFVEEHTLDGDFLRFTMIDQSSFKVGILNMTCCSRNLKDYVVNQEVEEDNRVRAKKVGESSRAGRRPSRAKKQKEIADEKHNYSPHHFW